MGHRSRSAPVLQGRLLLNRERELSQLCRALGGALRGRGQIVLTAGEAGIGKTTLAQVFAARANTRGARVLWGRSGDLEGSPPYWPWAEALRALAEDGSTDVQAFFGPGARYLTLVLPELQKGVSHAPKWGTRYRFFKVNLPDCTDRPLTPARVDSPTVRPLVRPGRRICSVPCGACGPRCPSTNGSKASHSACPRRHALGRPGLVVSPGVHGSGDR